jgi:hypothetical protein
MSAKPKSVQLVGESSGLFIVVDGVKIARRGGPGTPEAGTWVPLVAGWSVRYYGDLESIEIEHDGHTIPLELN